MQLPKPKKKKPPEQGWGPSSTTPRVSDWSLDSPRWGKWVLALFLPSHLPRPGPDKIATTKNIYPSCRLESSLPLASPSVSDTGLRLPPFLSTSSSCRQTVNLMRLSHSAGCPCHGCSSLRNTSLGAVRAGAKMIAGHNQSAGASARGYATPVDDQLQKEYAFEVRLGPLILLHTMCASEADSRAL